MAKFNRKGTQLICGPSVNRLPVVYDVPVQQPMSAAIGCVRLSAQGYSTVKIGWDFCASLDKTMSYSTRQNSLPFQ